MMLVSASWAMRYAARPTPVGTGRRSPSTRRSTASPVSATWATSAARSSQAGRRGNGVRWIAVGAQHREELAHLAHRRSRRLLDRGQRFERLSRVFGADQASGAGLDRYHAHRVSEDIVQLPRDPQPLLGDGAQRSLLSLSFQVHRPLLELRDQQPAGPHVVAEQPRAGDDEHRRGIGGACLHRGGNPREQGRDDQDQARATVVQAGGGEVDDKRDGHNERRSVLTGGIEETGAERDSQRCAACSPAKRDRGIGRDDERCGDAVRGAAAHRPVGVVGIHECPTRGNGDDRNNCVDRHECPCPGSKAVTIRHLCDGNEAPIGRRHSRAVLAPTARGRRRTTRPPDDAPR